MWNGSNFCLENCSDTEEEELPKEEEVVEDENNKTEEKSNENIATMLIKNY